MLVQFGNNLMKKIPLTAKLDEAVGRVQFWLPSDFFSSNYFQVGQHVVQLRIQIINTVKISQNVNAVKISPVPILRKSRR